MAISYRRAFIHSYCHQVVSYFYYKRAAWNVVARKITYPDEPLPAIDYLMLDFDSCVITHNEECNFEQDSDSEGVIGHKSQVAQFCGHDPVCIAF